MNSKYRRLQVYAMMMGFGLVIFNGLVAYFTGPSATNLIFVGLGLVVILLRGDLAGGGR